MFIITSLHKLQEEQRFYKKREMEDMFLKKTLNKIWISLLKSNNNFQEFNSSNILIITTAIINWFTIVTTRVTSATVK